MNKLYWLDQIKPQNRIQVGDKAFYLSKIIQMGYPVIPGFVVSASMCREFIESLNNSDSLVADLPYSSLHLDVNNWQQLQQVAFRLRQEIISGTVPQHWVSEIFQAATNWQGKCLILRPSLSISSGNQVIENISGLLDSVFCTCHPQAIAEGLKQSWSQLFRARSLVYWQSIGINLQEINLAVLIQPVENAIASGSFESDTSGAEIEATYGLGLAITKGEVLPDIYYLEHNTGVIQEQQLGNKILAYSVHDPNAISDNEYQYQFIYQLITDDTCLFPYLISEEQQKQYALSEEFLQQIIILGNQLINELGTKLTIKWTITLNTSTPKLYITQINAPLSLIPNLLLKGISAANGRVSATVFVVPNSQLKPSQIPQGVILITPVITPDWLPLLNQVSGIITERGGLTSHAAILARELGIPAIVSAKNATNLIHSGEIILLDGDRGEVYRLAKELNILKNGEKISLTQNQKEKPELDHNPKHSPNQSHYDSSNTKILPMITTQLLVNLSQANLIETVKNLPIDGVGLLRSELMMLNILQGENPQNWLLYGRQTELLASLSDEIEKFAIAFTPRPILYRSLDWRPQDLPSFNHGAKSSENSILGEHGTWSYLQNPAVFELELQALLKLQKKGYRNIHLMLPFVRTVEELVFCRHKIEAVGLTKNPYFQLWIMAEVPSILFLLPDYIKTGINGISIGTNDLTQLILAVDREQGELANIFNQRHPAVMGAIAQLINMARDGGISCSICGQAPALYPEIIDKLVQWGITSISVEPEAIERTYQAIARAEQHLILAAARKLLNNGII